MSTKVINKLIIAGTLYFWGAEEIYEESSFWYGLLFKGAVFSSIILVLALIF
ncbi:MAG: hypothetical protein ABS916_03730 [Carnobacterium sp.]|uniref:hypothetical protein n=1 Tax=Carnobacterium sp. TaxID=48221 RepID=UPI0033150951